MERPSGPKVDKLARQLEKVSLEPQGEMGNAGGQVSEVFKYERAGCVDVELAIGTYNE